MFCQLSAQYLKKSSELNLIAIRKGAGIMGIDGLKIVLQCIENAGKQLQALPARRLTGEQVAQNSVELTKAQWSRVLDPLLSASPDMSYTLLAYRRGGQ